MRKIKIITDSCADLGGDLLAEYGIDYCRMSTVEDGKESPALLTWSCEDAHRLYNTIRDGKRITTAQVSVEEFRRVFGKYLDEGYDILYIGCSGKQSGSVNTGSVTAEKLMSEYPGAKIFCIDSLNASMGEGMLAVEAAKMAGDGKTIEEIYEHILSIRKNVNQFVTVHTLDHLKKAGRVTASSAFFGNLMEIKPILISDANGVQTAVKKVKGRQNSLSELVRMLKERIREPENQTVYIAHADCNQAEMDTLVKLIREEIPAKDIYVGLIGPIIGASIGPDAIGIWGLGEMVTHTAEEK